MPPHVSKRPKALVDYSVSAIAVNSKGTFTIDRAIIAKGVFITKGRRQIAASSFTEEELKDLVNESKSTKKGLKSEDVGTKRATAVKGVGSKHKRAKGNNSEESRSNKGTLAFRRFADINKGKELTPIDVNRPRYSRYIKELLSNVLARSVDFVPLYNIVPSTTGLVYNTYFNAKQSYIEVSLLQLYRRYEFSLTFLQIIPNLASQRLYYVQINYTAMLYRANRTSSSDTDSPIYLKVLEVDAKVSQYFYKNNRAVILTGGLRRSGPNNDKILTLHNIVCLITD